MSKKKISPRAPFVVTVAMAGSSLLALAPACNTNISTNPPFPSDCPAEAPQLGAACSDQTGCTYGDSCGPVYSCSNGAWVDSSPPGTCNPPAPPCPETSPEPASACDLLGQTCLYPDACGGTGSAYCGTLADGSVGWQLSHDGPPCNPPACPEVDPPAGSACSIEGQICDYQIDLGCGPEPVQVTCASGVWQETLSNPTCNPPAPEPCTPYATEAACQADAACIWYVPGCGMPALPAAGCHAKTPCAADTDCISGDTCQSLVIDPCWMKACDACGENVLICMPPPGI